MSKRIAVMGCGALGGYAGGYLTRAGHDLHVSTHEENKGADIIDVRDLCTIKDESERD